MSICCGNCLFQGDRSADDKGNAIVFCLVKANWYQEDKKCSQFREYADINKEIRVRFASEIRQEEFEDKRLKKIVNSNLKMVFFIILISFVLFFLTVKIFDKYIF